jgi:manganese transport protein
MNLAEIFLGILTSMGGFVEIGELTFTLNGGKLFAYSLAWVTLAGTLGIIVYCEMAGRVAAVRRRAVFHLIRERDGFVAGLATLGAATAVNLLTCAAEIGAVAWIWQLCSDGPYRLLLLAVLVALSLAIWFMKFQWIERVFGLGGLAMIVFIAAFVHAGPDWSDFARGLVPQGPPEDGHRQQLLYWYYAVALLSSIMLPYETYFYASGGIEDGWKPKDVPMNRVVCIVGFGLGALLSLALIGVGHTFFAPSRIDPQLPGSAALAAALPFGPAGLFLALAGMFFAFGGAAIETALCAAYNVSQFAGWPWGKHLRKAETGRFSLAWLLALALGTLLVSTGIDPVSVVEYSIVFSVVVLPFSYFPVLMVARDRRIMGKHANGPLSNALGWLYLVLITSAAVLAVPLFLATHQGRG